MNILLIQTDQQRRDSLPCYGNTIVRTPHIDRLAERGTVFNNAFTPSPISAPARASLLTGKYPLHHGIVRNPESGSVAGHDFTGGNHQYGKLLTARGYRCRHIGKWHIGSSLTPAECDLDGVFYPGYGYPEKHPHYLAYLKELGLDGFVLEDKVYAEYPDGQRGVVLSAVQAGGDSASVPCYLAEQALAALQECAQDETPFFISCNFWGPHVPYIIPRERMEIYEAAAMPIPPAFDDDLSTKPRVQQDMKEYWGVQDLTDESWQQLTAACYGYISLIDDQVGRMIDLLEELGLADNTAVIFTSDHGGMVGSHGLCDKGPYLYDDICRIPQIVAVPEQNPGKHDAYVYNMDLMPTFLDLAGIEIPEGLDAQSLLPLVRGQTEAVRAPEAFIEFYGHQVPTLQKCLRTDSWKYVFNGQEQDEYYDLEEDPLEMHNRIEDPEYNEQIRAARERLCSRLQELRDPILRYFEGTRLHKRIAEEG